MTAPQFYAIARDVHPAYSSNEENDMTDHLALFGADTSVRPTATRMPSAFNHGASKQWLAALNSKEFQDFADVTSDFGAQWEKVLKVFLKTCSKDGVYPFAGQDDFEDMAKKFLRTARRELSSYIQSTGILKRMSIRSVKRETRFNRNNFTIRVVAQLRPITDPTVGKWLQTVPVPGFRAAREGMLEKDVHAHVKVEFSNLRGSPTLAYEILCISPLRLTDSKLTTRKALEKYVQEKLWSSEIRNQRIKDAGARLF